MKSYIIFIRHGITEGIERRLFYGWSDLPVTEAGFKEIAQYKAEGVYPALPDDTRFYTTDLRRTHDTLKAIYGDVPYKEIFNLKEINFGDWEMRSVGELERKRDWDAWMNDKDGTFTFPKGDSMLSFGERIKRGDAELVGYHRMQELAHRHSGNDAVSVVVCHGGTISATMINWFPGQKDYFFDWTPTTGLGYIVYFQNGDPVRYEPLKVTNLNAFDLT